MKKRNIILTAILSIIFLTIPAVAQKSVSGDWEWKGKADAKKRQSYFSIRLDPKNNRVSGTMYFNELINGEVESDGGIMPFVGTVKGNTVTIEFDENNYEPSYTKNVRYKKPKGRLLSTATLQLKNGRLELTVMRGTLINGMPKRFTLNRAK